MSRSFLPMRPSSIIGLAAAGLCCLALAGCGSGSGSAPKGPKVIQSPAAPPPNLNAQAGQLPPEGQQVGGAKSGPTGKSTKPAKPREEPDPFADELPKNRFEIAGDSPLAAVGSTAEPDHVDRFVVGEFVPGTDSTTFEVGAVTGEKTTAAGPARNAGFELPGGFAEVASFGYSEQGLPLRIRGDKSGALMALVPGGSTHLGSNDGPPETQPQLAPFLETFYMDVTEVTLAQYQKFRDDIKQKKNSRAQPALNDGKDPNLPALGLPWGIALGFANWSGKELPTEAEFEHAARGPHGWRTPWGDDRAVWPTPRSPDLITPVATFRTDQSVFGIFDLAGNAREWCSDFYSDTAHQEAASVKGKTLKNWGGPKKASASGLRVVKGNGPEWSAWHREGRNMTERHPDVGFRCVLRVKLPQSADSKGD